jgi:O-antigen/teichoic acid export membrane protein
MATSGLTMQSDALLADLVARGEASTVAGRLGVAANALAVMAGKTLTMGLGFVFWLVAAHEFARPEVGLAAAVVAAMMLCTQLAIGGVGSALITCYGDHRRRPALLLDTSATVVVLSAFGAGCVFLAAAALGLHHLGIVAANPLYALLFVVMTVFGTVAILLDQLSIALGRGDQVLVRGVAFGAVTVAGVAFLPIVLHGADSFVIFVPWAVAGAVNVALGVAQLRRLVPGYRYRTRLDRPTARVLFRHGFPNYALTLAERAPGLVLPVIVAEVLSPAGNATWYAVWMMAWVVYTMPISAGLTLFAEGSHRPAQLHEATRDAVRVALLVGLAGSLVLAAFAHRALSLLGSQYGATGAAPLRILLVAFVPLTFVQAYFATSRARRRLGEAVVVGWVTAVASVAVATAAGVMWGLVGMACGWLAVQTAAGGWAVARNRVVWNPLLERVATVLGLSAVAVGVAAAPLRRGVKAVGAVTVVTFVGVVGAVGLWIASLHGVALERMNGLGLASVLHVTFYAAVALLTVMFVATLFRGRVIEPLLLALVVVLIVMLFALTPVLESVPRFAVTWRHVGITQAIADSGRVNPRIDAYFNWPGFFILSGVVAKLAGFRTALPLAAWSPVYLNLAYLLPLLMIMRSLTSNARLVWLSVWVFYLGNWIGQDYFSPQGFSFFLYLLIVAILLRWFAASPPRDVGFDAERSDRLPRGLLLCVLFLYASVVPTHQLTPVAIVFATAAVALVAARRLLWLPSLMGALMVVWWATGARTFLNGHLGRMLGEAGKLDAAFTTNVASRVGGDADHRLVADLTLVAGATIWALACLGAWRLLNHSTRHRLPVALAAAPLPLVVMQTYGGEMLLRVQLFALPFTAFLAAAALLGVERQDRARMTRSVVVTGALLALGALFVVVRYGNEKVDHFTSGERTAVYRLYSLAKPGAILVAGTGNLPWKFTEYASHRYRLVVDMPHWSAQASPSTDLAPLVKDVRGSMLRSKERAYLVIGRSEELEVDQFGLGRPGALGRFKAAVSASPFFRTVYSNADATIFTLAPVHAAAHRRVRAASARPALKRAHVHRAVNHKRRRRA